MKLYLPEIQLIVNLPTAVMEWIWSYGNEFAGNVISGVSIGLSRFSENCKNNFLVVSEGPINITHSDS